MTAGPAASRGVPFAHPLLVVVPLLAILLVLHLGTNRHSSTSSAPVAASAETASVPARSPLGLLLVQVLTILVATRVCGLAVRRLSQPHVVGEMLAGILLGPSLLGLLAPRASATLFPPASLDVLGALSGVGMVLYMFLVGMDLDAGALHERGAAALLTSHVSIAVPFFLGAALSLGLFDRFAPPGIPLTSSLCSWARR